MLLPPACSFCCSMQRSHPSPLQRALPHKMPQRLTLPVCDFSAVQRRKGIGGGVHAQIILQNRKTKKTQSAPREREGEREWVMRGGCRTEKSGQREEGGRERWEWEWEREWQWMYLSRSQIINRDSVVWIERKRGGKWGRGRVWACECACVCVCVREGVK